MTAPAFNDSAHMTGGERRLRAALRASMNRHWFARLVIAAWAGHIPLFAFLVPDSLSGVALEHTGAIGYMTMAAIALFALAALADSAVNDLLPQRFTTCLMEYRHVGFMLLAIALVLMGSALAVKAATPMLLPSFLLPAMFAVGVTWLDLYDRSRR